MSPDLHDQASAYAVGALSPEESAEFAAHLETCSACQREVAALDDVTAELSDSVASDPPPELRAAVLAEIARTPQDPGVPQQPLRATAAESAAASVPMQEAPVRSQPADNGATVDSPAERSGDADVVPLRRGRVTTWATSLVAAAAVVAAIAFGGMWWQERQDAEDATTQADQLAAVLAADDVQRVPGVPSNPPQTGAIVMSRDEGKAFFVGSDLPDLPDDEVYEAWTIKGSDAPAPAGTFTASASSPTAVALPAASLEADQMAITVEPEGGSDRPTSDAVVTFTMPPA